MIAVNDGLNLVGSVRATDTNTMRTAAQIKYLITRRSVD